MSVRERLAAKKRRTVTVPVQVSDPGPARGVYEQAERQVTLLQVTHDAAPHVEGSKEHAALKRRLAAAKKARDKAKAAYLEHFEQVEFQAAPPAEAEAVLAEHTDSDGNWDQQGAVAPLAALCAVEEELRDEAWWAEQLSPSASTWSVGERESLWVSLLGINVQMPGANLPKD